MTAMTCKLNGLFSIGEEFDDEDLLGTDWAVHPAPGPSSVAAAASSGGLRASCVARGEPGQSCPRPTGERSAAPAAGQTASLGLRRPFSAQPPAPDGSPPRSCAAPDDFDDWDVDLAELDACDGQADQPLRPPAVAWTKSLRPSTCGGTEPRRDQTPSAARQAPASSSLNPPPRTLAAPLQSPNLRPAFPPPPQQSPRAFSGRTSTFPAPRPIPSPLNRPHLPQRPWATPGPSPQARGLFETVSPAPSSSTSTLSPHPLSAPVFTNRLVQLVSASNKLPKKRPRSEPHRTRTRRFPGPAGLLPEQPPDQILDTIVVSAPVTPAHGAVARVPSQASGSQSEEDDFGGGAWKAMKAELGLDERNRSCFLHSHSVVMVIRKAALKQLAKNKVPNMAVLLKSIVHTHADAKAVFKDPTGEIQGTVHRQLLEDRAEELKVGAVLLLKQVSVFSPSHRNHYLNVTPNNLLRIYAPDGVSLSSSQLPPLVLEPMLPSPPRSPGVLREPVSRMHLEFDEEEEEGEGPEGGGCMEGGGASSGRGLQEPAVNPAPQHSSWDSDGDLDQLLGELPEDTCSL